MAFTPTYLSGRPCGFYREGRHLLFLPRVGARYIVPSSRDHHAYLPPIAPLGKIGRCRFSLRFRTIFAAGPLFIPSIAEGPRRPFFWWHRHQSVLLRPPLFPRSNIIVAPKNLVILSASTKMRDRRFRLLPERTSTLTPSPKVNYLLLKRIQTGS